MIYVKFQNQIAMTTTDIKSQVYLGAYPEQLRKPYVNYGKVLRNDYVTPTYPPTKLLVPLLEQHSIASSSVTEILKLQKFKPHVPEIPT